MPWVDGPQDLSRPAERSMGAWVSAHCEDLPQRVTLMPAADTPRDRTPFLEAFTANGKVFSHRSYRGGARGPVLAAWPGVTQLERAVQIVPTHQVLIVYDWGSNSNEGWATAVQAFDARTETTVAPLDFDLHGEFELLLRHTRELHGGAVNGRDRHIPQRSLRTLKSAGLDEDFVVTYCIALGFGDHGVKRLREHYRAA